MLPWGGSQYKNCYLLQCGVDKKHEGIKPNQSLTAEFRQGASLPLSIENRITDHMLPKAADLNRVINLLSVRFPDAHLNSKSGALFVLDCWRLDLDPLLGEVVPVAFWNKGWKEYAVTPIITENGYLSMAARGCPDDWEGPPSVEPITDKELKKAICEDPDAWVWKATGRRKSWAEGHTASSYGWFTQKDLKKATEHFTVSSTLPGNQARIRAINRWVREVYPEAKQKMLALTAEWRSRAEGVTAALAVIDAEYKLVETPKRSQLSKPAVAGATDQAKDAPPAEDAPTGDEEFDNLKSAIQNTGIDPTWLSEVMKKARQTDSDAIKWIMANLKVKAAPTLTKTLESLTVDQRQAFVTWLTGLAEAAG